MDSKKFTIVSIVIFILSLLVFMSTVYLVFFRQPVTGNVAAKSSVKTQNIEIGDVSTQIGATGRFYKGFVYLEVKGKKAPKKIEEKMPQIKDSIISTLAYSDIQDFTKKDGMNKIKEKIKESINEILSSDDVVDVLFTQSIVQ